VTSKLKIGNVDRWDYQFNSGWRTQSLSLGVPQEVAKEHSLKVTAGVVVWFWSEYYTTLPVIYYQGKEILPSKIIEWAGLQEEVNRLANLVPSDPGVEGVAALTLLEAARRRLADFLEALGHPEPAKGAGILMGK